jgi:DNA-binding beta-propeller fold protein YncE
LRNLTTEAILIKVQADNSGNGGFMAGKTGRKSVKKPVRNGSPVLPSYIKLLILGVIGLVIILAGVQIYILTAGRLVMPPSVAAPIVLSWGEVGTKPGAFNTCRDVACDAEGNVYVADTLNFRIQKFSGQGKFIKQWGGQGADGGQFGQSGPCSVSVDPSGGVWVLDWTNNDVVHFDGQGQYLGRFRGGFYGPQALQVDGKGSIWVANAGGPDIHKFDPEGGLLGRYGRNGTGKGEIREPKGVAVDVDGGFYVVDAGNRRIQKFNKDGRYVARYKPPQKSGASFMKCVISPKGYLWVTDESGRIWVFDKDLKPRKVLTEPVEEPFGGLNGIAFDGAGSVFVTNHRSHRVIKLGSIPE